MHRFYLFAIGLIFAATGTAIAGPPDFVLERGDGPPFAGNPNPGQDGRNGPPDFVGDRRQNDDETDEAEEEETDNGGGPPPGLCSGEGPDGQAGASHLAHLNFSLRDPETGLELENGSWGRMRYFWRAPRFNFVFNGHQLPPEISYTLTYQPQPVPSTGVLCLGSGVVNGGGNLHIADIVELNSDLPMDGDESETGAIFVLVVSEDVSCDTGQMLTYLPGDYLFGDTLIEYVDTDLIIEEDE